jgi:hypothetical protein
MLPSASDRLLAPSSGWQRVLRLALVLVSGVGPLTSFAYQAAFEGLLISDNPSDPPIPIEMNLVVNVAGVSGTVKTGSPQPGAGVIGGDEQFGTCDLRSDLGRLTLLRMKGSCGPAMSSFEGKYALSLTNGKRQSGVFRLSKANTSSVGRKADPGESNRQFGQLSTLTPARCMKANSTCLLACPRGDQNAELLCVNRCKQKLNACKGTKSVVPPTPDTRGSE